MESAFEVKNLTKAFGDVTALDNVSVARGKSLVSMPVYHRFTFGPYETAKLAARRNSTRRWKLTAPLTGLIDWIRAGEYENYGAVRPFHMF